MFEERITALLLPMASVLLCYTPADAELCQGPICEYTFVIRHGRTMAYRRDYNVYNVGMEAKDLVLLNSSYHIAPTEGRVVTPADVHTADGVPRNIIVINGEFPGPAIEVMEGTQIVVNVVNLLHTEVISLHWHGLLMEHAFWMDGTPFVSQFPIIPGHRFQYRLRAFPSGTHWYHSHMRHQTSDGLYGFICVHPQPPALTEYKVAITDWFHEDGITKDLLHPFQIDPAEIGSGEMAYSKTRGDYSQDGIEINVMRFQSALINGRGRWQDGMELPLENFTFTSGLQYRLRLLGAAGEFAFEVSLDEHEFTVVATDGADIANVSCDSVILNPGERVDVLVEANKPSGRFWLRSRTLRAGIRKTTNTPPWPRPDGLEQEVQAVVTYDENDTSDPTTSRKDCTQERPCRVFNCPFLGYKSSANKVCINIEHTTSVQEPDDLDREFALKDHNFTELIVNINFEMGTSINGFRYKPPHSPLFPDKERKLTSCSSHCTNTTSSVPCACTHIASFDYNSPVQIVISNFNPSMDGEYRFVGHHPMHIHGHNFAVVAVGYPSYNRTTGLWTSPNPDIVCESALCRSPLWRDAQPQLNLVNPPIRDTVTVPAHGYVVLRFLAWNPGHWLFHCHTLTHIHEGMAMLLSFAEDRLMSPPDGLQEPADFSWSLSNYETYMLQVRKFVETGIHLSKENDTQVQQFMETGIHPSTGNGQSCGLKTWHWVLISLSTFFM